MTDASTTPSSIPIRPSNTEKDPDDWTTGGEPMTGAQASYLKTLSEEAKDDTGFEDGLTKAEASKQIDALKKKLGRADAVSSALRETAARSCGPGTGRRGAGRPGRCRGRRRATDATGRGCPLPARCSAEWNSASSGITWSASPCTRRIGRSRRRFAEMRLRRPAGPNSRGWRRARASRRRPTCSAIMVPWLKPTSARPALVEPEAGQFGVEEGVEAGPRPRPRRSSARRGRGRSAETIAVPSGDWVQRSGACGATNSASGSQACHCRPISIRSLPSAP